MTIVRVLKVDPSVIRRNGEVWRLITSCLLHANWRHLSSNMMWQLVFGVPLERLHGSVRVGTIYMGGVIMGKLNYLYLRCTSREPK